MVTIDVDRSLSKSALYEHRFIENIKKLYKSPGKCDDKQQYKAITEAAIVSTPTGFTDNNTISYGQSIPIKNLVQGN